MIFYYLQFSLKVKEKKQGSQIMHYLYQFLDKLDTPIYIGITGDIKTRINTQHFGKGGHLSDECYEEAYMVLYCQCLSEDDAKIRERYFINKLSPKYNNKMKNGSKFSFEIPEAEWKYLPIDKNKITKNKQKKRIVHLKNLNLSYKYKAYKSLSSGKIQLLEKINCNPTILKEKKSPFADHQSFKISVLSINGITWTFVQGVREWLDNNSGEGSVISTIKLINESILNINEVCITTDRELIKKSLRANGGQLSGGLIYPSYPKTAVLVSIETIERIIKYIIDKELNKYVRELERKGYIRLNVYRPKGNIDERLYSLDDFINASKKNMTYLGDKLLSAQDVIDVFESFKSEALIQG